MAAGRTSPRLRPVIRVFVSSTFSDLKQERDALQRDVFPRLERFCLERQFQFQAIDLRWGVPGEAGLDHRTMRICFDELRRCQEVSPRPNFLVLLGDRYGWRPLPEEIDEGEFQKLKEAAERLDVEHDADTLHTPTGAKAVDELAIWYRLDTNARPPTYVLRSRRDPPAKDTRDYTAKANWEPVEALLWSVINRAFPPAALAGRFQSTSGPDAPFPTTVKFQGSATEQEIWCGAMTVADAPEHVVAWFRNITNGHEFQRHKRIGDFFDLAGPGRFDSVLHKAVVDLKTELHKRLSANIPAGPAGVIASLRPSRDESELEVIPDHISSMCLHIERRLQVIIEKQVMEYWALGSRSTTTPTPLAAAGPSEPRSLELERQAHHRFGELRAPPGQFVGRKKELGRIKAYLADDADDRPLVVHGPSGTGKTALLARAAQCARQLGQEPLIRFLGTTPRSSDIRGLLVNLCSEMRLRNVLDKGLPSDLGELANEFNDHLATATKERPILVMLDGVDQLDPADGGRGCYWLRAPLPAYVKVVVSCISTDDDQDPLGEPYWAMKERGLLDRAISIETLTPDEAMLLLNRWLEYASPRRGLTDSQSKAIAERVRPLAATECRRPLFLRILFEECYRWPSHKVVSASNIGDNADKLLGALFDRLSEGAAHGKTVEYALAYLTAAWRGLSENELLEILWSDPEYKKHLDEENTRHHHVFPPEAGRIPVAIWARLRHDLDPYLTERQAPGGIVLNFYHRQVGEASRRRFLPDDVASGVHKRLAKYFGDQKLVTETIAATATGSELPELMRRAVNARKVDELPYHQTLAPVWSGLEMTLCSMEFLQAKVAAGLAYEAVTDFDRLETQLLSPMKYGDPHQEARPVFRAFARAYNQEFHAFRDRPRLTAQQIYSNLHSQHGFDGPVGAVLRRFAASGRYADGGAWLRRVNVAPTTGSSRTLRRTLSGHAGPVTALGIAPDGSMIASGGIDGNVQIWRPSDGVNLAGFLAHTGGVTALAWGDDRGAIVTAGYDRLIRVWDWRTRQCVRSWRGHLAQIRALTVLPGQGRIVTCSEDRSVRIWNLANGAEEGVLKGHNERVLSLATDGMGRLIASGGEDRTLKIWNARDSRSSVFLRGHSEGVRGVAVDAQARWAVSVGDDKTLRIWNLASGQPPRVVPAHSRRVTCVGIGVGDLQFDEEDLAPSRSASTPFAVTGSDDSTLKIWDLQSARQVRTLRGHAAGVNAAVVAPSGRWLASAGEDGTVRVWSVGSSDKKEASIPEHSDRVSCLAVGTGTLASCSDDKTVKLWDPIDGSYKLTLRGHQGPVTCLALMPGPQIVSGCTDRTLRVWDGSNGTLRKLLGNPFAAPSGGRKSGLSTKIGQQTPYGRVDAASVEALQAMMKPLGHRNAVSRLAVLDHQRVVSGGRDGSVCLWDISQGQELASFTEVNTPVVALAANSLLKVVAAASAGPEVLILEVVAKASGAADVAHWSIRRPASGAIAIRHDSSVTALEFSPEGVLASASRDRSVGLWNATAPGVPYRRLTGHDDWVLAVAIHDGTKLVASGSRDATVRVWDIRRAVEPLVLRGHRGGVRAVAFDDSGTLVYSIGDDERLICWRLDSQRPLAEVHVGGQLVAMSLLSGSRLCLGLASGGLALFDLVR